MFGVIDCLFDGVWGVGIGVVDCVVGVVFFCFIEFGVFVLICVFGGVIGDMVVVGIVGMGIGVSFVGFGVVVLFVLIGEFFGVIVRLLLMVEVSFVILGRL